MATSRHLSPAFGATLVGALLHAGLAVAQEQLERVEITGSAIKRIDAETAVPITVLQADDLRKEGITTAEEVLRKISSSQSQFTTVASVGAQTGGASFADLRGLGQNKTLILLNGRRLANSAVSGAGNSSAADLNAIPFAALQRVEVLRDGASALYGTDAIGGVINFITKREFTGGVFSLGTDDPQHGAGKRYNGSFSFGTGDLDTDKVNLFGVLTYQKQNEITGPDRPYFSARSVKTSPTTFPGQYNQGGKVENPLFPGCNTPAGIPLSSGGGDKSCGYLYAREVDIVPVDERMSAYFNGTAKLSDDARLKVEYFITDFRNTTRISGVPYGAVGINPGTAYYPGNGITPLPQAFTLDPTYTSGSLPSGSLPGAVRLKWRDEVSGGRQDQDDVTQQRFVASLEGAAAGWDYQTGLTYNGNQLDHSLVGGYTNNQLITQDLLNGVINPFSLVQSAAGAQAIATAAATGSIYKAKGQVYQADAKGSREIGDFFGSGRASAIAVGTEFRHEQYSNNATAFANQVVSSTGFDPRVQVDAQRNVAAVFSELNVPILSTLDVTAAARFDHYSDFGSTTNPKAGFRFQPFQALLFRGSYSTGFRAPALFELNSPLTFSNAADNLNDPVRCPNGVPIAGASESDNCAVQFITQAGGNQKLKPEKSKNLTFGMLFEPVKDARFGADLFYIKLRQSIGTLQDTTVFANPTKYANYFHRAPDGSLSADQSLCPGSNCGYVSLADLNLGDVKTSGVDLTGSYKLRAGDIGTFNIDAAATYIKTYDYQLETGGQFFSNVGYYGNGVGTGGGGVIFRWQTVVTLDWTRGPFGLGVTNYFKTGYQDQNNDGQGHLVPSYTLFDVYGSWKPTAKLQLVVGVRNVLDKLPPYSNQASTFQVGYDPRYTDPFLRNYYVRGTYTF